MSKKEKVEIPYGPGMRNYMANVISTLVEQDDCKGAGGHGVQEHGGHGVHGQISVGMGNKTVNFREIIKK